MNDMNAHLDKIASSMVAIVERDQVAHACEIEMKDQITRLLSKTYMIGGLTMDDVIDAAYILSRNLS